MVALPYGRAPDTTGTLLGFAQNSIQRTKWRLDTGSADALVRKRVRGTRRSQAGIQIVFRAPRSMRARAPALPVFGLTIILQGFGQRRLTLALPLKIGILLHQPIQCVGNKPFGKTGQE